MNRNNGYCVLNDIKLDNIYLHDRGTLRVSLILFIQRFIYLLAVMLFKRTLRGCMILNIEKEISYNLFKIILKSGYWIVSIYRTKVELYILY